MPCRAQYPTEEVLLGARVARILHFERQPICTFKLDGNKKYVRVGKEKFIEIAELNDIIQYKSEILNEVKKYL